MDFERSIEFNVKEMPGKESSYSEEEQAKTIEGTAQDRKRMGNKRKPLDRISPIKEKIIISYKGNLEKIFQLIETISRLYGENLRQEEQIIEEIKSLRRIQDELLNALILEQKGMLTEGSISKEAWNLIQ